MHQNQNYSPIPTLSTTDHGIHIHIHCRARNKLNQINEMQFMHFVHTKSVHLDDTGAFCRCAPIILCLSVTVTHLPRTMNIWFLVWSIHMKMYMIRSFEKGIMSSSLRNLVIF